MNQIYECRKCDWDSTKNKEFKGVHCPRCFGTIQPQMNYGGEPKGIMDYYSAIEMKR